MLYLFDLGGCVVCSCFNAGGSNPAVDMDVLGGVCNCVWSGNVNSEAA
jgi:hypothetical protein